MSKNQRGKRNRRKNKNDGQSTDEFRDQLYDDFLSMFGESVDPIEIFNVLKRNEWKAESSVDELMKLSQQIDSKKPSSKFDTSLYEEDFNFHQAMTTKVEQSSQNLNYYNFSPHSSKTVKSNVQQFSGFHDVKVVYKGENSEDEADADIIIEEEDVFNEQGLKVLQESSSSFQANELMNAISSHIPDSTSNRSKNSPKTLNSDFEKFNNDNIAFQKNVITQRFAPSAPTLNFAEMNSPSELETTSIHVIYEECLEIVDTVDRVCSLVLNSIKVMILLRGCPGSGKSFMAEKIITNVNKIRPHKKLKLKDHVFSTDDFFMTPKHGYRFDPRMLPDAHDWNKKRAQKALLKNVNPVIIDNTNTQIWEMAPYVQLSVQFGYVVEILEPDTKWKFNEYELFRRNIHGVPRANIRNMLERYEHGITKNNILQMLKYQYDPSKQPPQSVIADKLNLSRNTQKDYTVPPKVNGRPANFPQPSTDLPTSSFSSFNQKVDKNQNSCLMKNDLSSNEDKYSNLTASCRSFFEKSLLSSASGTDDSKAPLLSVSGSDDFKAPLSSISGTDDSKVPNIGARSVEIHREQNNRSRAGTRNALLSSMLRDFGMPDVVAKSPSVPQTWLTSNKQEMPKPLIGDDEIENTLEKSFNSIDFGKRENLNAPSESVEKEDKLLPLADMVSKIDIVEQHQSISAGSSDTSEIVGNDLFANTGLKDSLNSEDNPSNNLHPNVTQLEHSNVVANLKLFDEFRTKYLKFKYRPVTFIQNVDSISCLAESMLPSNDHEKAVITQSSDTSSSHSKYSTDSVLEIESTVSEEVNFEEISITKPEENCQESTPSSKTVDEIKEDNLNGLQEECQSMHPTPNELTDSSTVEEYSCLGNDKENAEKSNQEQVSSSDLNTNIENEQSGCTDSNQEIETHIIEAKECESTTQNDQQSSTSVLKSETVTLNIDSNYESIINDDQQSDNNSVPNPGVDTKNSKLISTKDNQQVCDSVPKEVETAKIDFKNFRFKPTKLESEHSVSNGKSPNSDLKEFKFTASKPDYTNHPTSGSSNKDLFFSELKDDPVDDYFNDAEINALLESLTELDLEFITDETKESKPMNEAAADEEFKTVRALNSENLNAQENIASSDSDSTNICKKQDSSEQSSSAEAAKNSDDSDQFNSISPIAGSPESKLATPQSPSNESDELNTSYSKKILSESFMTVAAEDDNISDSVYFDVDSEANESNIPDESNKPNKNEVNNIVCEVKNSKESYDEKHVETITQTTVVVNGEEATENNEGESCESMDKELVVEELIKAEETSSQTPVIAEETTPQTSVTVEETSSQTSVIPEETSSQTVEEAINEANDSIKTSNSKDEEVTLDSGASQSLVAEEPIDQKQSSISIDGVKAFLKGGVPVKTFDVMTWLKNNFIKESSGDSSAIQQLMSDTEENALKNDVIVVDESGNTSHQSSNPVSEVEQKHDYKSKPSRDMERSVPAQQNYSIIGSNESNAEDNRKRNKFLNWDSVDEPENSWAEKMKNTLGASDGVDDGKKPKSQRENNLKPVNSNVEGEESVDVHEIAATKVIDILSDNTEQNSEETVNEEESLGQKLQELGKLFPETQSIYMEEILRQCKGDVNWAAGLLLEGGCDVSAEAYCTTNNGARGLVEIKKSTGEDVNLASSSKSTLKKQKKEKKNANNNMSEARMELKKMMEQNFVLSENSYSDHLLKLLKFRRGEIDSEDQMRAEMIDGYDPELFSGHPGEQFEGVCSYPGEDFEGTEFLNQEPQTAEPIPDDEEMLEFVFNKDVITTLSYNFGSSGFPIDMAGVDCPVKLPMRLARELHSYWMDSVEEYLSQENMRMQMMIKEDEELAKRLQQEEACAMNPNLQEVIDYETALMLHEANLKKTRDAQGTDSTVAAKLSLSILAEKYPKEKEEFLSQLLSSNNNSLHNTLALLKITKEQQHTEEQQIADDVKHEFDECDESSIFEESETLQSSYERSRDEAKMHFNKRNEYFQRAQQEYTSGSKAAASFYSQLANMHMKKMEEANCKAATLLLCTSKSTKNTLDLHFYQAKEAVQVLDLFIDASMTRLEESRKPRMKIFIITGRGLHSVNGRSVIKPIVMRRLQQRKIRYHEDETNPGAIICTLTRQL